MSQFIGELVVRYNASNLAAPWQHVESLGYQSDVAAQTFHIEPGTFTDFCSVPRVPVAYTMLANRFPRAGAMHDELYRRRPISRQLADEVLREMLILEGATHFEAMEFYLAVRAFGGSHWVPPDGTVAEAILARVPGFQPQ